MRRLLGHVGRRMLVAVGLLAVSGVGIVALQSRNVDTALPSPVLDIETWSGSFHLHTKTTIGVLTPVDVNGDLIPDVDVLVDFLDANGVANPPDLSTVVAPHLQVRRDSVALALGKPSPPLKLQVNITVLSAQTLRPDVVAGLGFATGAGGSIPPHFSMLAQGLSSFFNPLTAQVDTIGGLLGGGPKAPINYEGPLSLVASVDKVGDTTAAAALTYKPWPGAVNVTYSSDQLGQHILYQHSSSRSIDLDTAVRLSSDTVPSSVTSFNGRIDRLPRSIKLDLLATGTSGDIRYQAHSSGRHPDITADVSTTGPTGAPLLVHAAIEGLPLQMHATWSLPAGGPVHAAFDASGEGVAAIEASMRTFAGTPRMLTPWVPTQRQYLNYQSAPDGEQFLSGRIERLRAVSFDQTTDGFQASLQAGDGELPLVAHAALDRRSGTSGALLDGTATIAPLPDSANVALHAPGIFAARSSSTAGAPAAAGPVQAVYDASESTDIDTHVEIDPAGATAGCGNAQTLCGDLRIRHLPEHIAASFGNLDSFGQGLDIVDTPRPGGAQPDFFADVTIGPGVLASPSSSSTLLAANATTPLVGHAELLGFPPYVRVRALTDATTGDLKRAEYHACNWNFTTHVCDNATPLLDKVGVVNFSVRNFLAQNRPANIPPPTPATPLFVTLTARQQASGPLLFEGAGSVSHIAQAVFANHDGILGGHTEIGGGQNFSAHLDADLPSLKAVADAAITPLPATFDFCMRREGAPFTTSADSFAHPCESSDPFGEAAAGRTLNFAPMALNYTATAPTSTFAIGANVNLVRKGAGPGGADLVDKGSVSIANLPLSMTAQVRTGQDCPSSGACLPVRALYSAPPPPSGQQITIDAALQHSVGDSICEDARDGADAQCARAELQNLPSSVQVCYDPGDTGQCDSTNAANNLKVTSTGDQPMNIAGLELSDVHHDASTGKQKVLVLTGPTTPGACPPPLPGACLTGFPTQVTGQIKSNSLEIDATPSLPTLDAVVRNYIAPDPINFGIPAQRAGLPAATQQFTALARGDFFKATAHLQQLKGVSYRSQLDSSGNPLQTKVVTLDFNGDQTVRAYADILDNTGAQTIADLTMNDVPAGITLCVRGTDPALTPAVVAALPSPTWCDTNVPAGRGAFQFQQHHAASSAGALLGVHGFVRSLKGDGTLLTGTVDIDGIPPIVQGQFGGDAGGADVGGFAADDVTPQGIQDIRFHVATFDLQPGASGYTTNPKPQFVPRYVTSGPFPAQTNPNQSFLSVSADDRNFEAAGDIGASGAHLQHVLYSTQPCAKPDAARNDYPFFPTGPNDVGQSQYQCIRADFVKGVNPVTGTNLNPVYLYADVEQGGNHLALRNAGLSDVPPWVQVTITKTATTEPGDANQTLRRRCGAQSTNNGMPAEQTTVNPAGQMVPPDCMAPLVRFDSATLSPPPAIFGTIEVSSLAGGNADLNALRAVQPREQFPSGYFEQDLSVAGAPTGIRAKVGLFSPPFGTAGPSRVAAIANLRFNVPGSLSIDQVQSWSHSEAATTQDYFDASDMRFHYAVRDYTLSDPYTTDPTRDNCASEVAGQTLHDHIVPCLGTIGVMAHSFPDNGQILVGDGVVEDGFAVPGEVGVDLYDRDNKGQGEHLIQVDAKMSTEMSLGATVLGGAGATIAAVHGQVLHIPGQPPTQQPDWVCNLTQPATTNCKPTERLRADILGDGQTPPPPGSPPPSTPPAPAQSSSCSPLFCAQTLVHVRSVNALFDFQPDSTKPAVRRVDAVIRTGGTKNGMEVAAFDAVDAAEGTLSVNGIHASASLDADAIDVFIHAGIPFLANLDFDLVSSLQAGFSLGSGTQGTNDFKLRQNLIKLEVQNGGPGPSQIGPINYNIYLLHADATLLFVKLLGIDFVPPSPPPLDLGMFDCKSLLPLDLTNGLQSGLTLLSDPEKAFLYPGQDITQLTADTFNTLTVNAGATRDIVVNPLSDPRLIFSGVLGAPLNILDKLVTPFFCLLHAGSSDIPLIDSTHPEDPIATVATAHPVPDTTAAAPPGALTTPPTVRLNPLTVDSGQTVAMCGTHSFSNITVNGTVVAATLPDTTHTDSNGRALCDTSASNDPYASLGKLLLVATGDPGDSTHSPIDPTIVINGALHADADGNAPAVQVLNGASCPAAVSSQAATGNSGAPHGVAGGAGSSGAGGAAYGDTRTKPYLDGCSPQTPHVPGTEIGAMGSTVPGGPTPGVGGGALALQGDTVTLGPSAVISANATNGGDGDIGALCSTGNPGAGGGSGGGVLIEAAQLQMGSGASISANGGNGGSGSAGGGGGGSGGIVKLINSLTPGVVSSGSGQNVFASGGSAGGNGGCTVDSTHNAPPAAAAPPSPGGSLIGDATPQGHVKPFDMYWHNNNGPITVNFRSAGTDPSGHYDVHICGVQLPLSAGTTQQGIQFQGHMPTSNNGVDPCGSSFWFAWTTGAVVHDLGAVSVPSGSIVDGSLNVAANSLGEGYYGVWAAVVTGASSSCFVFFSCPSTEPPPLIPDTIMPVDNTLPGATLTAQGPHTCNQYQTTSNDVPCTNSVGISLKLDANDPQPGSGLDRETCIQTDDGGASNDCHVGINQFQVTTGDGMKHLHADVVDKAGNHATKPSPDSEILLDTTVPTANLSMSAANGNNGFYKTPPMFTINGYNDGNLGSSSKPADPNHLDTTTYTPLPPSPAYFYRFDQGSENSCNDPCTVDTSQLQPGTHMLFWTPIDAAGNRLDAQHMLTSGSFTVDPNPPLVAITSVPSAPDGLNGWFTSDPRVVLSATDGPGESGIDTTTYTLDGSAPTPYIGPIRLSAGAHTVCAHTVDRAGNDSLAPDPCKSFNVDDAPPTVQISAPPINGSNGWYTTPPVVSVNASDASPGSGLQAFYVSVDGAPFVAYTAGPASFTIPAGLHNLRAYAIDNSGQRSLTGFALYQVDVTHPLTTARVAPPAPALHGWFRELPLLYLQAADGDRSAGVGMIRYAIDSGPMTVYTGPVQIPEGRHVVSYQSTDLSGDANLEPLQTLPVNVDVTPTSATALNPVPAIWIRLDGVFGPVQSQLNWTATENLSTVINVRVLVYDEVDDVVRHIDDGTRTVVPGVPLVSSTAWDGRDDSGAFMPAGLYYYRVVITDDAGNVSQSGQSTPLQIQVQVSLPKPL